MNNAAVITVTELVTQEGRLLFVANGPDGHRSLLARGSRESAERDGLEYFLSTRCLRGGKWVFLKIDEDGNGRAIAVWNRRFVALAVTLPG